LSKLHDPNLKPDEGESGEMLPAPDTLINNKSITALAYGFVKNSISIVLAGIVNNGLAIGKEAEIQDEFEFMNPANNKFPSFHPNDILRLTTSSALVATNNGLVELDILSGKYLLRNTSYGLPMNLVEKVIPVHNNLQEKIGYLVGTGRGIAFSPNAIRWVNVDKNFDNEITVFHTTQDLNGIYDKVFIGTTKGLYFFDIASYIDDNSVKVISLEGISGISRNNYINSVAFDSEHDILYIATDDGLIVIDEITAYIQAGDYITPPSLYKILGFNEGLSSTMCYDIVIMPSFKKCVATANGVFITSDFTQFSYITKKIDEVSGGLESYMCNRIIRKTGNTITVLHPLGFTEGIVI
jgi:ligand-binding sensor domain-containing protein